MNIKAGRSKQAGAALIVALVALLVLTLLGVRTMSDVMSQSSVVRNEQFRQKVFYAASSEVNVQINSVNGNTQNDDDPIIDSLLATGSNGIGMQLDITETADHEIISDPVDVNLDSVMITGRRVEYSIACPGESIGVNAISGDIDATAILDDGRADNEGSIKSSQKQRYTYCWP